MTTPVTVTALDLGASSGRVVLARVGRDRLDMEEVHRFPNEPVRVPTGLRWDVLALWQQVLDGLAAAARAGDDVLSVGVDTWAVDYGLLDASGELLGAPVHYRDNRTDGVADHFDAVMEPQELYELNGLQRLPFTTLYQLLAARGTVALRGADSLLMVPDLVGHWLTGARVTETTNASTTGLLDVHSRTWSEPLVRAAGLPRSLLSPLCSPGDVVAGLLPEVARETGLPVSVEVVAVGSHDTASAVVGTPLSPDRGAYIACGTWALVGLELEGPVLTPRSREAGFTNEAGVDGRTRFLHNVMGLWVLQESVRTWRRDGVEHRLDVLLDQAAQVRSGGAVIDVDDASLLPPGPMPERVRALCRASGQPEPTTPAEVVRCVLDSLAAAFARTVRSAAEIAGHDVHVVHLVGGGSLNTLLCQLTADACGLPVEAGPAEATAIGNVLVQARAGGALPGSLEALRDLVRRSQPLQRYEPSRTGDAR